MGIIKIVNPAIAAQDRLANPKHIFKSLLAEQHGRKTLHIGGI